MVGRGICHRAADGKDSFVGLAGEGRLESKRKIRAMPQLSAGCPDNPRKVTFGTITDAPNASRHLVCCSFLHTKGRTQTTQQQSEQSRPVLEDPCGWLASLSLRPSHPTLHADKHRHCYKYKPSVRVTSIRKASA